MRRRLLLAVLTLGVVGMLLVPGAAAQVPTQDSVILTGGPAPVGPFIVHELNATSGPSGENPTGQVRFGLLPGAEVEVGGPVTCLAVRGNTATINFQDQIGFPDFGLVTVQVVDGQPDTFDANVSPNRAPTDCAPLPPSGFGGPLGQGNITIVDAPPLPTTAEQCKNGGWRNFPGFKNQGDCVSFVATGGRNPPPGS
jgi:hypothetical protein